jgi:flagellar biosynthesis protein FlhF
MKVKTFHALTMQDAMRAIKEELGPDAIILSAKEVREGGRVVQAFNRPVLEVMAASDQDAQRPSQVAEKVSRGAAPGRPSHEGSEALPTFQQTLHGMLKPNREATTPPAGRSASSKPSQVHVKPNRRRRFRTVVNELGRLLEDLSRENIQSIGSQPVSMLALSLIHI